MSERNDRLVSAALNLIQQQLEVQQQKIVDLTMIVKIQQESITALRNKTTV